MSGSQRRVYDTLDGLRAAGAQLVVMRHLPELFFNNPRIAHVPESFLAVDLFYLVSGVVVAGAYGQRLASKGLGLWAFFVTRIIRLYPLYILGLAIGLAAALLNVQHDPHSWWTPVRLIESVATGLLLLPMLPGLATNGTALDGPVWTLVPEIASNLVWAATLRWVRVVAIGLALLLGAAGVVWGELHYHTLDIGYSTENLWAGFARAGFSFFVGVVVFQIVRQRRIDSNLVPWICVALLTVVLAWRPARDITAVFELSAVLLGFPLLIAVSALFEPGPRTAKLFSLIGRASWGVYILHEPVARLLAETVMRHGPPRGVPMWAVGAGFLVLVNFLAWALDRWFETPVRKVLTRWWLPKPKPAAA